MSLGVCITGNKIDLIDEQEVSEEQGENYAKVTNIKLEEQKCNFSTN